MNKLLESIGRFLPYPNDLKDIIVALLGLYAFGIILEGYAHIYELSPIRAFSGIVAAITYYLIVHQRKAS